MSAVQSQSKSPSFRLSGAWDNAWKISAVVALLGLLVTGAGYAADLKRFAFSYLFAFVLVLTIGLGAMFFVLIQHLTSAGWSVTVRRTSEFVLSALPVMTILFAPIYLTRHELFSWMAPHHAEHGAPAHGGDTPGATASHHEGATEEHHAARGHDFVDVNPQTPMQHAGHAALLAKKHSYLNEGFFVGRAVSYFVIWTLLSLLFFKYSTKQDETGDPSWTVKAQKAAPLATALFAFTLTFAMFDWVMALDPTWYSTIFGVYVFAGAAISSFATVIVLTLGLRSAGLVGDAINTEHYHDLGKLMFGFTVFHAYIGFSQMMLIWYAAIPEELVWYHMRWQGGWKEFSIALLAGHFVMPFLFMMSRNVKRRLPMLGLGAAWLLVMHVLDIFWFVMPNFQRGRLSLHWMDVGTVMAVGGIYFTVVFFIMTKFKLIPVGDPRLSRALHFHNA